MNTLEAAIAIVLGLNLLTFLWLWTRYRERK